MTTAVVIFLAWTVLGTSFGIRWAARRPRPIPAGHRWHTVPWSWFVCSCGRFVELHADASEAEVSAYFERMDRHRQSCETVSL